MQKDWMRTQIMSNVNPKDLELYAVSDSQWLKPGERLKDVIEQSIKGGVSFVQLREKHATHQERLALGREIKEICLSYGVPFVINDDVMCAKELGVGAHVGQDDMELVEAREILGPSAIIGVSCQTKEQALKAQSEGADYLGVGSFSFTATKPDADIVGMDELRAICESVTIPIVVIGGINKTTISNFEGIDIDGIAVVSAIFKQDDKTQAAKELKCLVQKHILSN